MYWCKCFSKMAPKRRQTESQSTVSLMVRVVYLRACSVISAVKRGTDFT